MSKEIPTLGQTDEAIAKACEDLTEACKPFFGKSVQGVGIGQNVQGDSCLYVYLTDEDGRRDVLGILGDIPRYQGFSVIMEV